MSNNTFSELGKTFQEKVMQALIMDRAWAINFVEIFDPDVSFEFAYLKLLAKSYISFFNKHKEFPSMELLIPIVKEELKNAKDDALKEQIVLFLKRVATNKDLGDLEWVKEKAFKFCRQQHMKKALSDAVDLVEDDEKYDMIVEGMKKAIHTGVSTSTGLEYLEDIDLRYSANYRNPISTGCKELDQKTILNGGLGNGEIGIVVAPTGCHAKGTRILMYNGESRNVEDIQIDDQLMGPDSKPRTVFKLVHGSEPMYRIIPNKGKSFVVNGNHILPLRNTSNGEYVSITVNDWLKQNNNFKHLHKLFRSNAVTFATNDELPMDPYILGVLLGDGSITKNRIEITSADSEIADKWREWALKSNCGVSEHKYVGRPNKAVGYYLTNNRKHNNPVAKILKQLNLVGCNASNKFVPQSYKTASIEQRLQLLAGLLDTDGSLSNGCYDYISKSEQLAEDVLFLARSLGLAAYMNESIKKCQTGKMGLYYRVCISGNTSQIPCLLRNKRASSRLMNKNVLNIGFNIESIGVGEYYGFHLIENPLFLLEDFTVVHNCGKSHMLVYFGANAILRKKNVVHYTLELNERITGIRYDSYFTDISASECSDHKEEIKQFFDDNGPSMGRLIIKYLPPRTTSANTIRAHLEKLRLKNFKPDMLVVDYAGIMRSIDKHELMRYELKQIIQELRDLAVELDIPIWTALQSNKEGANSEYVDLVNMAEAYAQAHIADFVLGVTRKPLYKAVGLGSMFIAKNRAGVDGVLYKIHLDTARSKFKIISEAEAMDLKAEVDKQVKELQEQNGGDTQNPSNKFRSAVKGNKDMFHRAGG